MIREFSILRVRALVLERWEFPLTIDEASSSPFAGPFDEALRSRLVHALDSFPSSRRTTDRRLAWSIALPTRGEVEVWLTSDGSLFVEGPTSLFLVGSLYVHLMQWVPAIVLEDRITGQLHNRESLLELVSNEETATLPFVGVPVLPETSAWLN